jgi:transposase
LGIAEQVIYRWNKKMGDQSEPGNQNPTDQEKQVRELRSKLAEVTEERDILKKAVRIFSKQGVSR